MKRLLIGALLASVAMWFWGFLFWGVSPLPAHFLKSVPDEVGFADKLKAALPETGVYIVPNMGTGVSQEEFTKRHQAGPVAQVVYVREGAEPVSLKVFGGGWLHMFVCALILGSILQYVPGPTTFGSRYCILALAGTAAALWSNIGKPIWWHQPWAFNLLYAVYDLTSLLLAAVILAWYVRRP